jgi:hypothetical protein
MPNRIFITHRLRLLVLIVALPLGVMEANGTELRASRVREGEKERDKERGVEGDNVGDGNCTRVTCALKGVPPNGA